MCSPPTNNNLTAVHDHKRSSWRLQEVSGLAAAAAFGACDLLLSLINRHSRNLGILVTTIHFINCSDVYEGLLMKGGLYGLESWRTTPQLNY